VFFIIKFKIMKNLDYKNFGFSIIEILISLALLSALAIPIVISTSRSSKTVAFSRAQRIAQSIAENLLTEIKISTYDAISYNKKSSFEVENIILEDKTSNFILNLKFRVKNKIKFIPHLKVIEIHPVFQALIFKKNKWIKIKKHSVRPVKLIILTVYFKQGNVIKNVKYSFIKPQL